MVLGLIMYNNMSCACNDILLYLYLLYVLAVLKPRISVSEIIDSVMFSIAKANKSGDKRHPCLVPRPRLNW